MFFEFNEIVFDGTKSEIIDNLRVYLKYQELVWRDYWSLAGEKTKKDCGFNEARRILTKRIIGFVPSRYIFMGQSFDDIESLRSYLGTLEVRHLGNGVFSIGTWARKLYANMGFDEIKNRLIAGIINGLQLVK